MESNRRLPGVWTVAVCVAATAGSLAAAWCSRGFCRALGTRLKLAVGIGAIFTSSLCARTVDGVGCTQVLVCMDRGSDPWFVVPRAQALTAWMFDQIGVVLVWRDLQHCPKNPKPIVIRLSLDTPREVFPKALAASYPFEGVHIRVFYDRVRTVTAICPLPVLLAHVLAHEISHILQGTDQHSTSGVMKSRWDINDYARMAREPLPFTDLDVRAIHRGLGARTERFPGAARDERVADGSPPLPPSFCEDSKRP